MIVRNLFPKKLHFAKFTGQDSTSGYPLETFSTPVELNYNYQPISDNLDFVMFGEKANQMQKMIIPNIPSNKDLFVKRSKAYLDGATPTGEAINGANATHRVVGVRIYNHSIHVYFEKIKNTYGE